MESVFSLKILFNSVVYSALGLLIYALGFYVADRLTPGQLWKEIIEEHNTALAIIMGAVSIGIAIIIGSAIHG